MKEYKTQYKPKLKLITQNKTLTTKKERKVSPHNCKISPTRLLECGGA